MKSKDKILNFIDVAVYLILGLSLLIRCILTSSNLVTRIVLLVTAIAFIFIAYSIFNQKKLYNKAIYALNYELDPGKANLLYSEIVKHDFFKTYTKQRGFFDLMLLMEINEYDKAKWIIEMNEKKFESSDELKAIKLFYEMYIFARQNDNSKVLSNYRQIKDLISSGVKPELFTELEIDGLAQMINNNNSLALQTFEQIDLDSLCPKDKKRILNNLCKLASGKKKIEYKNKLNELTKNVKGE